MIRKRTPDDNKEEFIGIRIFLAGSIEMGSAKEWQSEIIDHFEKSWELSSITFYNPRRTNWDPTWVQEEKNENFSHQVNWELNHLDRSDIIFFYFQGNTKSPISLMELGRYGGRKSVIVCCDKEFWRRGNIEVLCTRENIPLFDNLESAIGALKTKIISLT